MCRFAALFLLNFPLILLAQNHKLSVYFNGISSPGGAVMVKIVNEKNEVVKKEVLPLKKDGQTVLVTELAAGKYAVQAYYDANNNQELDKNMLGIPQEKYGFSNNARASFGPPELKSQLFELQSEKTINIDLK